MTIDNELIYDIGMHDGSDTEYYLSKGYSVVAVDANPNLIKKAEEKFSGYIASKKLTLVNAAIANSEGTANFYISKNDIWSSLDAELSDREGLLQECIQVEQVRVTTLFERYGVPHYCKIDIEGYDIECLRSMSGSKHVPKYVSAEMEAVAEGWKKHEDFVTLNTMYELGYRHFKLVDQSNLAPLSPDEKFYHSSVIMRGMNVLHRKLNIPSRFNYRKKMSKICNYDFPHGSSGAFGEDIPGPWYNYETAKKMMAKNQADYFKRSDAKSYGFWCDWHAKL